MIVTLAGLAIDAMKREYDKDKIEVTYDLSVALPVSTISQANAKANSIDSWEPMKSLFTIHQAEMLKSLLKLITANAFLKVQLRQGVVFDETGKVIERKVEVGETIIKVDFQNKTLLHFDIGAGTTEVVVTEGVKFNPKVSSGLNYGVKQTILEIIKRWNRKYPLKSIDSMAEFNEIYFDSEHARHNLLKNESQTGMLQLAQQISSVIIDKIDDLKDDPYVFIYGGGAAVLKDYLQKILNTKGRTTNVTFLSEPMFVNARGLLVYTCSPRYEQQKEKELGVAANGTKS